MLLSAWPIASLWWYTCIIVEQSIDLVFVCSAFYGKTKKRSSIIRNNRNYLIENIQPSNDLIASLLSVNCITQEQSHYIELQRSTRHKNDEILHFSKSFNERQFSNFINCLRHANQKTVARIIEGGGGLKYKHYPSTNHCNEMELH